MKLNLRSFQSRHSMLLISLLSLVIIVLSSLVMSQFRATVDDIRVASSQAMEESLLAQLRNRGISITNLLAENLVNPVFSFDMQAIEELLRGALEEEDIDYVFVLDSEGRVLHDGDPLIPSFGVVQEGEIAQAAALEGELLIQQSGNLLDISADINSGRNFLGRVRVGLSTSMIDIDIGEMATQLSDISSAGIDQTSIFVQAMSIALVIIGLVVSILVSRQFLKPVRNLTQGAQEIAENNLSFRADEDGNDELALLAKSFNHMAGQVQETRESLEQRSEDLENEIKEKQLLNARLLEAEKLDAIGRLAGGVAHDFNNQLMVIGGNADQLARESKDEKTQEHVGMIQTSVRSAAELTKQLLAFARKGAFRKSEIDVHEVVTDVVSMLSRSVDKRINISTRLMASHSKVMGDATQLQNALLNLGINARDAIEGNGEITFESIAVKVDHTMDETASDLAEGVYLRLAVTDTGKGIDDATLDHIFDPFFTTKEVGKGTGLGLPAVYGTVHRHDGHIRVERGNGKTSFVLFLPLMDEPAEQTTSPSVVETPDGNRTLLLVDDEDLVRTTIGLLLESLNYSFIPASNGIEALAILNKQSEAVDAVILDMMMPNMGGAETFREIRKIDKTIPIIIASGYAVEQDNEELQALGPLARLQKPISMEQLSNALYQMEKVL